jgi:hypothetical protein
LEVVVMGEQMDLDMIEALEDGRMRARIRRAKPDGTMGDWEMVDAREVPREAINLMLRSMGSVAASLGCICGPRGSDGPNEDCPVHGRQPEDIERTRHE